MTRWLAAAKSASPLPDKIDRNDKNAPARIKSILSIVSEGGGPISEPPPAHGDPGSDADQYAEALRQIGPCGYGPIAIFLGWGVTRTANAEEALRKAGKIIYDRTGRGILQ